MALLMMEVLSLLFFVLVYALVVVVLHSGQRVARKLTLALRRRT